MEKQEKTSKAALAGGLAILALLWTPLLWLLVRGQFWQSDTFWLIEVGRRILEKGSLPLHDPYSFATTNPYTLHQWLTEVIFGLSSIFGLAGVAIVGEVVLALLFCVSVFRRMIKHGCNSLVAFAVIVLTVYSIYPDVASLRPQLFSFACFWILQSILEDTWTGLVSAKQRIGAILGVFAVGLIWSNCHASFSLGLFMAFCYFVASIVRFCISSEKDKTAPALFLLLLAEFACTTFMTPSGAQIWRFVIFTPVMYKTQEMQPLDWGGEFHLLCYCVLTCLSVIYLWRSVRPVRTLLAMAFFSVGVRFARLIMYFSLASCQIVAEASTRILSRFTEIEPIARISAILSEAAFCRLYPIVVIAISVFVVSAQPPFIRRTVPIFAAEYLAHHPVSGHLFCPSHAGSYLIYRFRGDIPVFMDTRVELYDAALCHRYMKAMVGNGWRELFNQYEITEALVPKDSELTEALKQDPDWKKIYGDEDFEIYAGGRH